MKSLPIESMDTFHLSRLDLTAVVTNAALTCIGKWGVLEKPGNVPGLWKVLRHESIKIGYRTPATMVPCPSSIFSIDIWCDDKKVFSTFWNSHTFKDYDLISLKRGPWIPMLLALAASCNSEIEKIPTL